MPRALSKDHKEQVVADWRTGQYSQRQLAGKHNISNAMVAKLTKGMAKDCEQIVSDGFVYKSSINQMDPKIVSAVEEAVDYKVRVSGLAHDFVEKSIKKATQMLKTVEDAQSVKALADAVDKNTITAGVNERHAKPTQITNQVANFGALTDDDLHREARIVRERLTQIVE